jgi:hypothetical protein
MDIGNKSPSEREAASIVASALRQDASAHEAGHFETIANRYDDVYAEVLALCTDYSAPVATAFTFWDWWADARNHAWQYYDGIVRDDWPRLAHHVADAVEAGTPITDPALVRHFQRAARPGLFARLGRLLGLRREPA